MCFIIPKSGIDPTQIIYGASPSQCPDEPKSSTTRIQPKFKIQSWNSKSAKTWSKTNFKTQAWNENRVAKEAKLTTQVLSCPYLVSVTNSIYVPLKRRETEDYVMIWRQLYQALSLETNGQLQNQAKSNKIIKPNSHILLDSNSNPCFQKKKLSNRTSLGRKNEDSGQEELKER